MNSIYLLLNILTSALGNQTIYSDFEATNRYKKLIAIAEYRYEIIETRSVLNVERGYNVVLLNRSDSTMSTTYKYDKIDKGFKFKEVVNGKFDAQDNAINVHIMQAMEILGVDSFICPFKGENFEQWINLVSGENIFLLNSVEQLQTPFIRVEN